MQQLLNSNYIQLLIIVVFFGFSALTWVLRQLKEQAEIRRRQQMAERRKLEALRTGRIETPEEASVSATATPEQKLAELAARRAEQIRRQAPARTMPQGSSSGPQLRRPQPGPRAPSTAGPRGPASTQRGPVAAPKSPAQRRQEMLEARRRALEARARIQTAPVPRPVPVPPRPVEAASPPRVPPRAPAAKSGGVLDRASLRRAIVLKEILDAPLALRQEEGI